MAKNVYGLDLGSYEIKVYDKKSDTIWKEKNVIAIKEDREIFAVGDQAYEMYEKHRRIFRYSFQWRMALYPDSTICSIIFRIF